MVCNGTYWKCESPKWADLPNSSIITGPLPESEFIPGRHNTTQDTGTDLMFALYFAARFHLSAGFLHTCLSSADQPFDRLPAQLLLVCSSVNKDISFH